MTFRRAPGPLALAVIAALITACSPPAAPPRPLADGPPPEYEPPRPFDLPAGSAPSGAKPQGDGPAPPAPADVNTAATAPGPAKATPAPPLP